MGTSPVYYDGWVSASSTYGDGWKVTSYTYVLGWMGTSSIYFDGLGVTSSIYIDGRAVTPRLHLWVGLMLVMVHWMYLAPVSVTRAQAWILSCIFVSLLMRGNDMFIHESGIKIYMKMV